MRLRLAVLIACACLSPACLVTTLQPVYDAESLVVDEALAGTWQAQEAPITVVVERGEWKSYRVTYTERKESYALVAYLTRIGENVFVDLTPAHGVEEVPLMIPVHGVALLRHSGDSLAVVPLDYDWYTAAIREKKAGRPEGAIDARQNILLTSKTDTLRAWLSQQVKTGEGFREPTAFTRAR